MPLGVVVDSEVIPNPKEKAISTFEKTAWQEQLLQWGVAKSVIQELMSQFSEAFIKATLTHCNAYFKTNAVGSKSGFVLEALKKGYYKDLIETQHQKTIKKARKKRLQASEDLQDQEAMAQRKAELEVLRATYMDEALIVSVLEAQKDGLLYPSLRRKREEKGVPCRYLQGLVDNKLMEEYGELNRI